MSKSSIKTEGDILREYEEKCGRLEVSIDTEGPDKNGGFGIAYIYKERFMAEQIYVYGRKYHDYPEKTQELYKVTFGDNEVMRTFATGKIKTIEEFENTINFQSTRAGHGYPFSGFIITDKSSGTVVGYEVIGNDDVVSRGQAAYLFNKEYHNSSEIKYVGFENVGALVFGYGKMLWENQELVNKEYNEENDKFEGGSIFKEIGATARIDNIGSCKILTNLGFKQGEEVVNKFEHDRYEFVLNYEDIILNGDNLPSEEAY